MSLSCLRRMGEYAMQQDGLVPIGDALSELDVPVTVIPAASPQARHQIFLSYAVPDQSLVENFADRRYL